MSFRHSGPSRKKPWSRPLADLIGAAISPALRKQGFGESDIILYWEDIVGERLAQFCEPVRLQWPARHAGSGPDAVREPATLIVRVEGAFALELQHSTALLVERINQHLGWRCVGRLALRQAPLEGRRAKRSPRPALAEADIARESAKLADIADEPLRNALARLGASVKARRGG